IPRRISSASRTPRVVSSAERAPVCVSVALVATVVPWTMVSTDLTNSPKSRSGSSCAANCRSPSITAIEGSSGVESTLWIDAAWPWPAAMKSVKVPPTSMPIFRPMRVDPLSVGDFQHYRHGGIARGTAGEQPVSAPAQRELLDQLDDGPRAHRRLRMAPDQGAAVIVHALDWHAGLAGKQDVVHRKGIVRLDRVHALDRRPGLLERAARSGDRRFRHVGKLCPRRAEAMQPDADLRIAAELFGFIRRGHDD